MVPYGVGHHLMVGLGFCVSVCSGPPLSGKLQRHYNYRQMNLDLNHFCTQRFISSVASKSISPNKILLYIVYNAAKFEKRKVDGADTMCITLKTDNEV